MKERPILFQGDMVRALLAGTKTQTRRPVKPFPYLHLGRDGVEKWHWRPRLGMLLHPGTAEMAALCPYGQPGDRLWVRQTFQYRGASYDGQGSEDSEWFRCYGQGGAADNWDPSFPHGWEPSPHMRVRQLTNPDEQEGEGIAGWVTKRIPGIHMPRWASRLTLEITDVRVERLQDISRTDAQAEGCEHDDSCDHVRQSCASIGCEGPDYRIGYQNLWERINGDGSWAANPWVWAVSFKVIPL